MEKLERVLQKLQQQIANDAANYQTRIALLEVELEDLQQRLTDRDSGEDA